MTSFSVLHPQFVCRMAFFSRVCLVDHSESSFLVSRVIYRYSLLAFPSLYRLMALELSGEMWQIASRSRIHFSHRNPFGRSSMRKTRILLLKRIVVSSSLFQSSSPFIPPLRLNSFSQTINCPIPKANKNGFKVRKRMIIMCKINTLKIFILRPALMPDFHIASTFSASSGC